MSADDPQRAQPADRARIEVVASGRLSDAELAALALALTPGGGDDAPAPDTVPAWRLAGLLEGVGGPTALDAPDLAHLRRRR